MSSWFSYGGTPSTSATEEERQQASLVAHDDMQNPNLAAQPSTRRAAVVEQGSIFDRISSGGSIFDRVTSGVSDILNDSHAVGRNSKTGDSSKEERRGNNNNNSHENTQRTVLAAQRNTNQAEAAAKQMEQDINWWKSSSPNDAGEEDTTVILSKDLDLLALASEEQFGDSTNNNISLDIFSESRGTKSQMERKMSQVEDPTVKSQVVQLPKSNQRKLEKVQEIVQWWERTIASGKSLISELSDLDQVPIAFEMLKPSIEWWRIKGKEFAVKNGHLTANESDGCDRKLKKTYHWLNTNLQSKEGDDTTETPNWLRRKNSETQGDGSSPFVGAGSLFGLSFGRGSLTVEEQRAKEMEEALSWLRSNDLNYDDPDRDDASAKIMNRLNSMIPGASDKDPVEVAATMEAALVWLRASDDESAVFHFDDGSVGSSKNIPGLRFGKPEKEGARAMDDALQALRANDASKDFVDDPSFKSSGSKLDAIPETRRSYAADWLCKSDATYDTDRDDQLSFDSSKVPKNSLLPLTPEEARPEDMANALHWLRSQETSVDMTMNDRAVPSFAAGHDQRGKEATSRIDWFQASGSRHTEFDDYSTVSGKRSGEAPSAEEQRAILMADELNQLRGNSAGITGRNDSISDVPAWTSHPGGQVENTVDLLRSSNLDVDAVDAPPQAAAVRNSVEILSGNIAGNAGKDDSISDVPAWMSHPGEQITSAVDLLRSNKQNFDAVDVPPQVAAIRNLAEMPRGNSAGVDFISDVPAWMSHPGEQMTSAVDLLRSNKLKFDAVGVPPRVPAIRKLAEMLSGDSAGVGRVDSISDVPALMCHPIEQTTSAIDLLRSNKLNLDAVDNLAAITNLAGVPMPRMRLALNGKEKVHGEGLELLHQNHTEFEWLRLGQPSSAVVNELIPSIADIPMPIRNTASLDRKENVAEKEMSWIRNSYPYLNDVDDPGIDLFNNFAVIPHSPQVKAQVKAIPRNPSREDKDPPEWSWNRNIPVPSGALKPIVNLDVTDGSAPWTSQPDEESDDGRGPTRMAIPEDLYSEESAKESKQKHKGIVIPVWLMLILAVMTSVIGTAAVSEPGATEIGVPPPMLYDPTLPAGGSWPKLPDLPVVSGRPCAQDSTCGFVMEAIDPVLPPRTRPLVNIEGTCQHWAREWLRTSRDIMEYKPERMRQRFAMAILYCEFNGDNWLEGDFWLSDLHECDWYTLAGVDPCGRREQYQIIRSYGQQMRGTLPPELSMISTLWEVTLSDNLIEGTIPPEYYKLSQLDTLGLAYNLFKGPIPNFVWEYENMAFMDLSFNFFTGTVPDTVSLTEPDLRVLFLDNNDLTGTIPTTFGQLDWKRLHLDGNQFSGTIPFNINAPRIEEIMLHNNKLTGTFPVQSFATEFAGKHSNLLVVTLNNNDLSGDMNQMCPLISNGRLQRFDVDLDKMVCDCCSSGD